MIEKAYVVTTNVGGVDTFFKELNGVKPHFVDKLLESKFMPEEDAVKLTAILNEKTDMYFEVIEVGFE